MTCCYPRYRSRGNEDKLQPHLINKSSNLGIAKSSCILFAVDLFAVDPMPGLSHSPHAPSPLGEDACLTELKTHSCISCNRRFSKHGFYQHILSSPRHSLTCCKPCRKNFCSQKDRCRHWGTSPAHLYTYDIWCDKNYESAESFLNHQRQCPQKHHLCKLCNIDFGPYELDLKKHLEEDCAYKDPNNRVCQIPFESVVSFEHEQRNNPTKPFLCLLCSSNGASPCHLAHNILEGFGFPSSLGNETHLPADEPSKLNTSKTPQSISEVAEDISDDHQARSAIVKYTGNTGDLSLHDLESPNNLALDTVVKRHQYSKDSYPRACSKEV